jgi:hypothetical protein
MTDKADGGVFTVPKVDVATRGERALRTAMPGWVQNLGELAEVGFAGGGIRIIDPVGQEPRLLSCGTRRPR